MIDFKKLNDPEVRARIQAEIKAREAAQLAKDNLLREKIMICEEHFDDMSQEDRGFVRKCNQLTNEYRTLSPKQEVKLFAIAGRFDPNKPKGNDRPPLKF